MANRLVLNLRSQAHSGASEPTSKADVFFRIAYKKPYDPEQPLSMVDTILGNIGEPLRIDDENNGRVNGKESNAEEEETTDSEDIFTNTEGHESDLAEA